MSTATLPPASSSSKTDSHDLHERRCQQISDQKKELLDAFLPDKLTRKNIDWVTLVWMTLMHAGCLAAPFFFTWSALGACIFLHWLTCSVGICLGYHRYLSHRSMKLSKPAEFFVMLCGTMAGEGTPLRWSATHRLHHARSDRKGDPHSPFDGKWWSHILWLFVRRTPAQDRTLYRQFTPDLVDRPMVWFFERTFGMWLVVVGVTLFAIGGLPMLLWGLCVRMTFAYHSTWFVNSATHLWGYRNYGTRDKSRNLWWVALVAYGEGWHNNHHAYPRLARAGHRWWEIDMTWWMIKLLKVTGQATDVKDHNPAAVKAD